jgi:hypothetical protein
MKKLFILPLLLLLFSCGKNNNLQKGAGPVGAIFKAKSITVETSVLVDAGRDVNQITLRMKDVAVIDEKDYSKTHVASLSSKLLYDNLSKEDIGEAEQIEVMIDSKGKTYRHVYGINDLKNLDAHIKVAQDYLADVKEMKYDKLYNYYDTTRLSRGDADVLIGLFKKNDSIIGKQDHLKILGFTFVKIQADVELPVVELWAEMKSTDLKYYNTYHFYLSKDLLATKVLGVALNDEN